MALPPCGRKVCEVAARVPTQVKLLFATLAYYAVICVVFWQVENWPVLDSIYFATRRRRQLQDLDAGFDPSGPSFGGGADAGDVDG